MEIKLRYVIAIRKKSGRKGDRTLYYWHRKGFPLRRLPDDSSSAEFVALVIHLNAEADAQRVVSARKPPGSFGRLVDDYLDSPEATTLRPRTLKNYEYWLRRLERDYGDLPFTGIDRPFVYELRDSLAETPNSANACIEVLRMVLSWAVERGLLGENPASRPRRLRVPRRSAVWDMESEEAFLRHADDTMSLAYLLGAYTA